MTSETPSGYYIRSSMRGEEGQTVWAYSVKPFFYLDQAKDEVNRIVAIEKNTGYGIPGLHQIVFMTNHQNKWFSTDLICEFNGYEWRELEGGKQ